MELPYNILSSSLDISSPHSIYTNTGPDIQTDIPHPINSDTNGTVLPVWSSSQTIWWMWQTVKAFDSFYTAEATKRIQGLEFDSVGILHHSVQADSDTSRLNLCRETVHVDQALSNQRGAAHPSGLDTFCGHTWMLKKKHFALPVWRNCTDVFHNFKRETVDIH